MPPLRTDTPQPNQSTQFWIQCSHTLGFESITKTWTDPGNHQNRTGAAGDNILEVVDPTGEEEESNGQLTALSENVMLEMAEMEHDALRDQEALQAQFKRLPAYFKAEVNELEEDLAGLGLGDDDADGGDNVDGDTELAD
ncbi:hypothetical protein MJO29_001937 [Puccinia striiformis f. sp. tritici]|uniref:hypothetical protein n=1 Tax=Puccinia striiformis f. sp. tritici TaxID=168172 RepID=UPI002007B93C|nr:hypothetical protein Pst134EA_002895 [Puccinia striiformis f. sp. tritici]KAH9472272.1 hypothetical protein Pst134EA_002895 [Puccinia striiformis f. sp. tritici]KAI7966189.1 hypothetical protein MJO29_001937 [Puccinia striiformis f. sp. tritici]